MLLFLKDVLKVFYLLQNTLGFFNTSLPMLRYYRRKLTLRMLYHYLLNALKQEKDIYFLTMWTHQTALKKKHRTSFELAFVRHNLKFHLYVF